MKRHALWLLVPLVLAAGIYGVRYRRDHPVLSRADVQFRQMSGQADEIQISALGLSGEQPTAITTAEYVEKMADFRAISLRGGQIRELEDVVRLMDNVPGSNNLTSTPNNYAIYKISLYHQKKLLGGIEISLAPLSGEVALIQMTPSIETSYAVYPHVVPRLIDYVCRIAPDAHVRDFLTHR